jgi:transcription initiation factor TFIIB
VDYQRSQYGYEEYKKKSRTGSPNTKLDFNLYYKTIIDTDHPQSNTRKFRRLRKIDRSYINSNEKTYAKASIELKRLGKALDIPNFIMEDAFLLFRKAKEEDLVKGRCVKSLVAACLYYSCRKVHYPIFLFEIVKLSIYNEHKVMHDYKILINELNLRYIPITYKNYVSKAISLAGLGIEEEKKLKKILKQLKRSFSPSKDPKILFASIIYIISNREGLGLTQQFLAKKFDICSQSIRLTYKKINKHVQIKNIMR